MYDLINFQKEIIENKKRHGFNTTNIEMEFCLAYGELGEAYISYIKKQEDVAKAKELGFEDAYVKYAPRDGAL